MVVNAFLIDLNEVTVSAYGKCVAAGKCAPPAGLAPNPPNPNSSNGCSFGDEQNDVLPVTCVTWTQANAYCTAMVPGGALPTEAQWERAARLNCKGLEITTIYSRFVWGDAWPPPSGAGNFFDVSGLNWWTKLGYTPTSFISNYDDGYKWLAPVGSFVGDANCLHDISGNATEWVRDAFEEDWYAKVGEDAVDPVDDKPSLAWAVLRGGSASATIEMRLAMRGASLKANFFGDVGFRCVSNGVKN